MFNGSINVLQDSPLVFVKNRKTALEKQLSASDAEDITNDVRKAVPALGYEAVRARVSSIRLQINRIYTSCHN